MSAVKDYLYDNVPFAFSNLHQYQKLFLEIFSKETIKTLISTLLLWKENLCCSIHGSAIYDLLTADQCSLSLFCKQRLMFYILRNNDPPNGFLGKESYFPQVSVYSRTLVAIFFKNYFVTTLKAMMCIFKS